jgi:hypothetical protein
MKIEEYVDTHCIAGTEKVENQILIRAINNLSLKVVLLILTQITGLASFHQASRSLIFYFVEWLRPRVYDLCTSLLDNMKSDLT